MIKTKTLLKSPTQGSFFIEAIFSTEHAAGVTLTTHPVQSGASITDHAIVTPKEVTLEVGASDVLLGANLKTPSKSVTLFQSLMALLEAREPVTLITRLFTYEHMVLIALTVPDDLTTMHALRATLTFQQVQIANVATVSVQQTVSSSKPKPVKAKTPTKKKKITKKKPVSRKSPAPQPTDYGRGER